MIDLEQIKISEDVLDVFDINVMGKDFFYEGHNYACYSGIPVTGFNFAYVIAGDLNDIEKIVTRAEIFFSERNTKFNVIVSDSFFHFSNGKYSLGEVNDLLAKKGYSLVGKDPRMVLDGFDATESIALPEAISISETSKNLDDWIVPLKTAFEGTRETSELYKEAHVRALKNYSGIKHYTLFLENIPISSITFTCQGAVAQIDDMGTDTAFQRRGYGAMLLKYSLNEMTKNFDIETFFLNTSEEGKPLYKKFGFRDFYFLNVFSKK